MDLTILSGNLLRIRSAKGKSQGEIAEAAGLSRVGYRNIESGASAPRVDTLMRIAGALDVKLEELLAPVRTLTAVRFRAQKKMTTRGELLADVARWLDDYNEMEALLSAREKFKFASVSAKLKAVPKAERPKRAAELARTVSNQQGPIRDIVGVLEKNGVKVFTPKLASEGFFGLSVAERDGGPAVVVNVWERLSVERWIFTAAHELGHLLLHFDAYDVTQTEEDPSQEKEADTFASHFLMPEKLFDAALEEASGLSLVKVVFKLKRIFGTSWQSVLYRIASRSPEGGKLWARFYAEHKARTGHSLRKTDEPEGLGADEFRGQPSAKVADEPEHLVEGDFVEERLHRLVRRAVEAEEISLSRGAEVLGMDLEAMRNLSNSWIA